MIAQAQIGAVEPECASGVSKVTFRIASTREDRATAFRLVYQNYLRKGLIEANKYQIRLTPYHLLPTTNVFIASIDDEIIATVSLIGDGELGLPMEGVYPDEVNRARDLGLSVGEVSSLAVRDVKFSSFLPIFVKLTRLMAQHSRMYGMDQFLIATHPKHARFYQRFMGFEQIGTQTEYPSVKNAPAVAYCLDFDRIDRERPACYDQFFGITLAESELLTHPMPPDEVHLFRPASDLAQKCLPMMT